MQYRTHTCGQLTAKNAGEKVILSGWVQSRRDHGGLIFLDLRDHYGITQLTFAPENKDAFAVADTVRSEFVIRVEGEVVARPVAMVNDKIATGAIEIAAATISILSAAKTPPFEISEFVKKVDEEVRLTHRYLDLRRPELHDNIVFRHKMVKYIHDYMDKNGFVEVNTPILANSSPEGARDFLVPSRLNPGKFYALPQAPQQFKQLLMVGGFDKYYQIAPCMRDEDPRADRSPGEFYQLDAEMAFANEEDIFGMFEPLFIELTEKLAGKKVQQKPFPRIVYKDALEKYGSDRPDLRFGLEMVTVTDLFANSGFKVFAQIAKDKGIIKALPVPGGAGFTRGDIKNLESLVMEKGLGGLAYIVKQGNELKSPITKFLSEAEITALTAATNLKDGDILFFGAGETKPVNDAMGALRLALGRKLNLIDDNVVAWAWIVDFPFFEWNDKEDKLDFGHNPFSQPKGGMEALTTQDPLTIIARQYDIIANGLELSSGAIRNTDSEALSKAFEMVGYDKNYIQQEFGHMMRAFSYGVPPHGGFAPGIERLVMLLRGENSIREVIAFPKNQKAQDLMTGSPSEVPEKNLKDLHIQVTKPKLKN